MFSFSYSLIVFATMCVFYNFTRPYRQGRFGPGGYGVTAAELGRVGFILNIAG